MKEKTRFSPLPDRRSLYEQEQRHFAELAEARCRAERRRRWQALRRWFRFD